MERKTWMWTGVRKQRVRKGSRIHADLPRDLGMNHESLGLIGLIKDHFDFESRQIAG